MTLPPRNYRVNFSLFRQLLPNFTFKFDLEKGLEELYQELKNRPLSHHDFTGPKFNRFRGLKERLHLLTLPV